MIGQTTREMSREEIDAFLDAQGHGLLSLASQNRGYGIPIVYGYDPDTDLFGMEFLFQTESKKRTFLNESEEASLCVYEWHRQDDWQSVIATGELERIEDPERIAELMALLGSNPADVVPWSVRSPLSELDDRAWYVLDPESLVGHRAD